MITKELQAYRTYQRFMRIMLTISGCWYMPTKTGKLTYYWSVCSFLLMILFETITVHVQYGYRQMTNNKSDLAQTVFSMIVSISGFGSILKVGTFLFNYNTVINFHRTLSHLFEEELARNKKTQIIMLSTLRKTTTLTYIYAIFMTTGIVTLYMPMFLFIIRDLYHFRLTTNYTLPTGGNGYIWTVPHNFLYHFHLLFEVSLGWMNNTVASSVDNSFGFYVYYFTSTMRALTFRLMNPLPNEKFSDLLKTCVAKHQILLRCRDTLEHIYENIILWHIITNSMLICGVLYRALTFSDLNSFNIFLLITVVTGKLLQTFIYTWYGTSLTNASEDFRKGIYFSEWPKSNLDSHVKINIILIMMQKPMTVNAIFSSVDISLFANIVNTTVSYFIMLQSIG